MLYPKEQLAPTRPTVAELIRSYGNHTLAFFALAPQNLHFLAPDGAGLVNYRLTSKVAVVLGDPLCAPQAREQVTDSSLAFCAQHGWRVAFYEVDPDHLDIYDALNVRAFKLG